MWVQISCKAIVSQFGAWTCVGITDHVLDGVQITHEDGHFWVGGRMRAQHPLYDGLVQSWYLLSSMTGSQQYHTAAAAAHCPQQTRVFAAVTGDRKCTIYLDCCMYAAVIGTLHSFHSGCRRWDFPTRCLAVFWFGCHIKFSLVKNLPPLLSKFL